MEKNNPYGGVMKSLYPYVTEKYPNFTKASIERYSHNIIANWAMMKGIADQDTDINGILINEWCMEIQKEWAQWIEYVKDWFIPKHRSRRIKEQQS